jgi:hypothetical protein
VFEYDYRVYERENLYYREDGKYYQIGLIFK